MSSPIFVGVQDYCLKYFLCEKKLEKLQRSVGGRLYKLGSR